MKQIVIALDKFKGSLSSNEASEAVAAGIRKVNRTADIHSIAVADGGEGTVTAALSAGFSARTAEVEGPTGRPVRATYALNGSRAVIELAESSGMQRLPGGRLSPLDASTVGLGQTIKHALNEGAREIAIGIGGSASTDGGAGLLTGLGARLLDERGWQVPHGGAGLRRVHTIGLAPVKRLMHNTEVTVVADVSNPLLGPTGAAQIFARQKGATDVEVPLLEEGMDRWAQLLSRTTGTNHINSPGAGAGGGTAFAALAALSANLAQGATFVLRLVRLETLIAGADLVITGEGRLDSQTAWGKLPLAVATMSKAHNVPTIAVVGSSSLSPAAARQLGFRQVFPLSALEPNRVRSMANAVALLERTGSDIATLIGDPALTARDVPVGRPS